MKGLNNEEYSNYYVKKELGKEASEKSVKYNVEIEDIGRWSICSDDIWIIRSNGIYSEILFKYKDELVCLTERKTLQKWMDELNIFGFFMARRGCIVNSEHVLDIHGNNILIQKELVIPIPKGRKRFIKQMYYDAIKC